MKEDIKFSILVPAFKARFLAECIESILAQTYTNLELIIVNDASPENLGEIVSRYDDPRIQYYVNEKNFGAVNVVDNWNKCLSYATGEYVICMGDDDKLMPCCLEEYRKLIKKYPGLGLYHGWTAIINGKSEIVRIQEPRMELEDVYTLMYFRFLGRVQYIGDFLFHTKTLREHNGFYKLPMAWGSDDISAFIASQKGIANTQTIVFQYRVNDETISNTGNTRIKLYSMVEYWKWVYNYLDKIPKSTHKNPIAHCLLKNRRELRKKSLRFSISEDLIYSPKSFFYWMKHRNIIDFSVSEYLMLSLKCCLSRLKRR